MDKTAEKTVFQDNLVKVLYSQVSSVCATQRFSQNRNYMGFSIGIIVQNL